MLCGEPGREGCSAAGHSVLAGVAACGAGCPSHGVPGAAGGAWAGPGVTAWDGAQVSARSVLWFPGF